MLMETLCRERGSGDAGPRPPRGLLEQGARRPRDDRSQEARGVSGAPVHPSPAPLEVGAAMATARVSSTARVRPNPYDEAAWRFSRALIQGSRKRRFSLVAARHLYYAGHR